MDIIFTAIIDTPHEMTRLLLAVILLLPALCNAQDLLKHPDGTLNTDWRRLFGHRDDYGTRIVDQRFVKRNDSLFLEIRTNNRFGDDVVIKQGSEISFELIMHKGQVKSRATNIRTLPYGKKNFYYLAEYPFTQTELDKLIQNKFGYIDLETSFDKIHIRANNESIYDVRSAASAIVTGRDINDDDIKIKTLKK
jgi:hypothetical protein